MGVFVGCQPSWDALDSPGCLTFLLALSKKKRFVNKRYFCDFDYLNVFEIFDYSN